MRIAKLLHRVYKIFISPLVPYNCRYYPPCSDYFISAIEKKGVLKGIWLGCKRILKCNPLFPGGYDPVE